MAVCAADGCWLPVTQQGGGLRARFCSPRCRNRQHKRDTTSAFPVRCCERCGRPMGRVNAGRRFCNTDCRRDEEPALPQVWLDYLAAFDRALRERTPQAEFAWRSAFLSAMARTRAA